MREAGRPPPALEKLEYLCIFLGPLPALLPAVHLSATLLSVLIIFLWPVGYVVFVLYLNSVSQPEVPEDCDRETAEKALSLQHSYTAFAAFFTVFMGFAAFFLAMSGAPLAVWVIPAVFYMFYLYMAFQSYRWLKEARRIIAEAGAERSE